MLSIAEVYNLFDQVGCCSFATLDGQGGVDSRIAHFITHDDEGLYFTTMTCKPFFRQLVEGGKLTAAAEYTAAPCVWDDQNLPHFEPGYMVRVSGDVRVLSADEVTAKAADNEGFNVAVYDIGRYPETVVLVLYRAWGELYDYDFNKVHRDHKILRERFAWGGATFVEPGFTITDACVACGACLEVCTHDAIVAGDPYRILGQRCDECGNCHYVCPADAVLSKGPAQ